MKKIILGLGLIFATLCSFSQEYQIVTTIESVVPAGIGRSRMLKTNDQGNLEEIKMENFFSIAGINFGNVKANDKMISDMINEMIQKGWELDNIVTGVYATETSTGIFISRYFFKKD